MGDNQNRPKEEKKTRTFETLHENISITFRRSDEEVQIQMNKTEIS